MANKLTHGSNLRWTSSRMMLREHKQALKQNDTDKKKINRPALAEDELEEISRTLQEAIEKHSPVELSYYKGGFIRCKICYPQRLDPVNRVLIVHDVYGLKLQYVFDDITDIRIGN